MNQRIIRGMEVRLQERQRGLSAEVRTLLVHSPARRLGVLEQSRASRLKEHTMQISLMQERLKDLNPYSILNRGYSITRRLPEKTVIRGVEEVREGDRVSVSLAEGELEPPQSTPPSS